MVENKQIWPVEVTVFEDTRVISDMDYVRGTSTSKVVIEYELPFDMTPDTKFTLEYTASNYNKGIYPNGVKLWFSNGKNIELDSVKTKTKTIVSKKLSEFTYWNESWLNDLRKFEFCPQTNKTTTVANSGYLGDNFSYTLRIEL